MNDQRLTEANRSINFTRTPQRSVIAKIMKDCMFGRESVTVYTKLNTVTHREIVIRNFHLRQLNAIVLNKHLT